MLNFLLIILLLLLGLIPLCEVEKGGYSWLFVTIPVIFFVPLPATPGELIPFAAVNSGLEEGHPSCVDLLILFFQAFLLCAQEGM